MSLNMYCQDEQGHICLKGGGMNRFCYIKLLMK